MKAVFSLEWLHARAIADSGCLVWRCACKDVNHRPVARINGRQQAVRRLVWEHMHGKPVPAGRRATTNCDTPLCVHPDHIITEQVGARLKGIKRSYATKVKISRTKTVASAFDDAQIAAIRVQPGTVKQVAAAQGMSPSFVQRIRVGKARPAAGNNPFLQLMAGG
jgi:hypothetical protein